MLPVSSYRQPLPQCKGPKLHPFQKGKADIQFKRLLSNVQGTLDSSDQAGHAYVFEISIDSKTYALKVFKFYEDVEDLVDLEEEEYHQVGSDIVRAHTDPFYRECRAYGRLIEAGLNGKVAARCFGYMAIPAETEKSLQREFEIFDWNRPCEEYDKLPTKRQPFRAILKEFIPDEGPLTDRIVKRILRDLKKMRKQGVYPRDIAARNYKAGLLLDFDAAMTEPHFLFQIRPRYQVDHYKEMDFFKFDQMIEDEGIKTLVRALPNDDYLEKLRPRGRGKGCYKQTRPYGRKQIHRRL